MARERMRTRHMAYRTEQAYLYWMRRYVKFRGSRHPREMGPADVEGLLTHLAASERVAASTQNQALQAIVFLYRHVLAMELPWLENVTRASRPKRLPVVLSVQEVRGCHSMGLAMGVSGGLAVRRPVWRRTDSSSSTRKNLTAGCAEFHAKGRDIAAGQLSYVSSLFRHAPAGGGFGHSHHPGVAGPRGCADHHDLYPRDRERCAGSEKPIGPLAGGCPRGHPTYQCRNWKKFPPANPRC